MKVVRNARELLLDRVRGDRGDVTIGFVPTMGSLHSGHQSLVRAAKDRCPIVIVSIFVNPLQFGPNEDFRRYPRDEERDLKLLKREGADIAFLPTVEEMYPEGRSTTVSVGRLAAIVEGASRPGHFDGVATVVAKLLNLVQPDVAFFGEKDAQQLAVVRKMVGDIAFPVEVVGCPTVRDEDGLAMSSRNAYLSSDERRRARALWQALQAGSKALASNSDLDSVEKVMWESMATAGIDPDYAHVVDPDTFERSERLGRALLVVAARVGATRLIDNLSFQTED